MKWQDRLLPLMSRMVVGLAVFFFVASLLQLIYLQWRIQKVPHMPIDHLVAPALQTGSPAGDKQAVLFALEVSVIKYRYHQGGILLMSRVWTQYLGFITGMILAMTGATFILGKIREPQSEMAAKLAATELNMKSTSPGLLLAGLGVMLMLATIICHYNIEVVDRPVYLEESLSAPAAHETDQKPVLKWPTKTSVINTNGPGPD